MLPKPLLTRKPRPWFKRRQNLREIRRDDAFAELKRSIEQYGILQPLIALDDGTLLAGNRRFEAGDELGIEDVPVSIYPATMTEPEIVAVQAVENLHREDLTEQEIFGFCEQLDRGGMPRGDIAKAIGKSAGTVTQYLSPAECPEEVLQHFLGKRLKLRQCYAIAKSPDPLVTLAMFLGGATRQAVYVAIDEAANPPAPRKGKGGESGGKPGKAIQISLPDALVVVRPRHVDMPSLIKALAEALREAQASFDKGIQVRAFASLMKDKAVNPAKVKKTRAKKEAVNGQ